MASLWSGTCRPFATLMARGRERMACRDGQNRYQLLRLWRRLREVVDWRYLFRYIFGRLRIRRVIHSYATPDGTERQQCIRQPASGDDAAQRGPVGEHGRDCRSPGTSARHSCQRARQRAGGRALRALFRAGRIRLNAPHFSHSVV